MICLLLSVSLACTVTAVKTDCWCKLDAGDPANTQGLQGVRNTAKPAVPSREGIMVKSGPVSPSTGDASMFILRTPLRKQRFYLRAATRSLLVTRKPLVSFLSFLLVLFRLGAARVPWQSIPKKRKENPNRWGFTTLCMKKQLFNDQTSALYLPHRKIMKFTNETFPAQHGFFQDLFLEPTFPRSKSPRCLCPQGTLLLFSLQCCH